MLPLLVAFVNANIYFDALTKQSLFNMSQAVETTRASRILLEELSVMERSARQFFVLHDPALLTNYIHSHERFTVALLTLTQRSISASQQPVLTSFANKEHNLFTTISQANGNFFEQNMVESFTGLTKQAYIITSQNNQLIDLETEKFKIKVARTQQLLFWQMLTLIPLAILIAALITWMIARPIKRMDAAISQLGNGNYEHAIEINGPGDLHQLGARLNWLRIALKDLHQQKQRFLQQASHELKTPLTAIREASELLNDGVGGTLNQQQFEIMRILRENSLRLQKMIENLLMMTEIQFNQVDNHYDDSHAIITKQLLIDMVQDVLNVYALTITNKNIVVEQHIDETIMLINIKKIHTVLDNLISNAIKFTPNNGAIIISGNQSKSIITIEVKDTGPGINNSHKNSLFEPFYRGEQPIGSLIDGSGLGLFIAKETIFALKGEISLVPSPIGAHFMLRLPNTLALTT